MSYRTIAVHVDESLHTPARLALAAQLAASTGAHLTGVAATGLSRFAQLNHSAPVWAEHLAELRLRAQRGLEDFDRVALAHGVGQYSTALLEDDAAGAMLIHARYADLVVLSQHDADQVLASGVDDLPPYLLLNCGCPLLVTPRNLPPQAAPLQHALLAWDNSRHAARAIADALPLLRLAQRTTLLMLNAGNVPGQHDSLPGADMVAFLARHGVAADIVDGYTNEQIGGALLNWAGDLKADLLVMGGYGHSRAREVLLGGATRAVLRDATIPVLLSH